MPVDAMQHLFVMAVDRETVEDSKQSAAAVHHPIGAAAQGEIGANRVPRLRVDVQCREGNGVLKRPAARSDFCVSTDVDDAFDGCVPPGGVHLKPIFAIRRDGLVKQCQRLVVVP